MADRNEKYRAKWLGSVQPMVPEPIIAIGQLQPRGSAAAGGVLMGVSGAAGMAMQSAASKAAGNLPRIGVYALTATTLHVFEVKPKGFGIKVKRHVASFPRNVFAAHRGAGAVTDQVDLAFVDGTVLSLEAISFGSGGFNEPFFAALTAPAPPSA